MLAIAAITKLPKHADKGSAQQLTSLFDSLDAAIDIRDQKSFLTSNDRLSAAKASCKVFCFADLVVMARGLHPIPSRTRP